MAAEGKSVESTDCSVGSNVEGRPWGKRRNPRQIRNWKRYILYPKILEHLHVAISTRIEAVIAIHLIVYVWLFRLLLYYFQYVLFLYRNPWTASGTVQGNATRTLSAEGRVWWSQGKNEVFHKGLKVRLHVTTWDLRKL